MTMTAVASRSAVVSKRWPGGTLALLASGPSLTKADVDYVRGRVDAIVAVNDAVRLAPFADVVFSSDGRWWSKVKGLPEFQGPKFSIASSPHAKPVIRWPGVTVLRNTGDRGVELSPDGLRTGRNSGAAAIGLAVHLGAARVILLGYDLGISDGRAHFYPEQGQLPTSPYHLFCRMFAAMVEPLKQAGVSVVNCSRITRLECFPRMPLEEALP